MCVRVAGDMGVLLASALFRVNQRIRAISGTGWWSSSAITEADVEDAYPICRPHVTHRRPSSR